MSEDASQTPATIWRDSLSACHARHPARPHHAPPARLQPAPPALPQPAPSALPHHAPPARPHHAPPALPQPAPSALPHHAPPARPQPTPPGQLHRQYHRQGLHGDTGTHDKLDLPDIVRMGRDKEEVSAGVGTPTGPPISDRCTNVGVHYDPTEGGGHREEDLWIRYSSHIRSSSHIACPNTAHPSHPWCTHHQRRRHPSDLFHSDGFEGYDCAGSRGVEYGLPLHQLHASRSHYHNWEQQMLDCGMSDINAYASNIKTNGKDLIGDKAHLPRLRLVEYDDDSFSSEGEPASTEFGDSLKVPLDDQDIKQPQFINEDRNVRLESDKLDKQQTQLEILRSDASSTDVSGSSRAATNDTFKHIPDVANQTPTKYKSIATSESLFSAFHFKDLSLELRPKTETVYENHTRLLDSYSSSSSSSDNNSSNSSDNSCSSSSNSSCSDDDEDLALPGKKPVSEYRPSIIVSIPTHVIDGIQDTNEVSDNRIVNDDTIEGNRTNTHRIKCGLAELLTNIDASNENKYDNANENTILRQGTQLGFDIETYGSIVHDSPIESELAVIRSPTVVKSPRRQRSRSSTSSSSSTSTDSSRSTSTNSSNSTSTSSNSSNSTSTNSSSSTSTNTSTGTDSSGNNTGDDSDNSDSVTSSGSAYWTSASSVSSAKKTHIHRALECDKLLVPSIDEESEVACIAATNTCSSPRPPSLKEVNSEHLLVDVNTNSSQLDAEESPIVCSNESVDTISDSLSLDSLICLRKRKRSRKSSCSSSATCGSSSSCNSSSCSSTSSSSSSCSSSSSYSCSSFSGSSPSTCNSDITSDRQSSPDMKLCIESMKSQPFSHVEEKVNFVEAGCVDEQSHERCVDLKQLPISEEKIPFECSDGSEYGRAVVPLSGTSDHTICEALERSTNHIPPAPSVTEPSANIVSESPVDSTYSVNETSTTPVPKICVENTTAKYEAYVTKTLVNPVTQKSPEPVTEAFESSVCDITTDSLCRTQENVPPVEMNIPQLLYDLPTKTETPNLIDVGNEPFSRSGDPISDTTGTLDTTTTVNVSRECDKHINKCSPLTNKMENKGNVKPDVVECVDTDLAKETDEDRQCLQDMYKELGEELMVLDSTNCDSQDAEDLACVPDCNIKLDTAREVTASVIVDNGLNTEFKPINSIPDPVVAKRPLIRIIMKNNNLKLEPVTDLGNEEIGMDGETEANKFVPKVENILAALDSGSQSNVNSFQACKESSAQDEVSKQIIEKENPDIKTREPSSHHGRHTRESLEYDRSRSYRNDNYKSRNRRSRSRNRRSRSRTRRSMTRSRRSRSRNRRSQSRRRKPSSKNRKSRSRSESRSRDKDQTPRTSVSNRSGRKQVNCNFGRNVFVNERIPTRRHDGGSDDDKPSKNKVDAEKKTSTRQYDYSSKNDAARCDYSVGTQASKQDGCFVNNSRERNSKYHRPSQTDNKKSDGRNDNSSCSYYDRRHRDIQEKPESSHNKSESPIIQEGQSQNSKPTAYVHSQMDNFDVEFKTSQGCIEAQAIDHHYQRDDWMFQWDKTTTSASRVLVDSTEMETLSVCQPVIRNEELVPQEEDDIVHIVDRNGQLHSEDTLSRKVDDVTKYTQPSAIALQYVDKHIDMSYLKLANTEDSENEPVGFESIHPPGMTPPQAIVTPAANMCPRTSTLVTAGILPCMPQLPEVLPYIPPAAPDQDQFCLSAKTCKELPLLQNPSHRPDFDLPSLGRDALGRDAHLQMDIPPDEVCTFIHANPQFIEFVQAAAAAAAQLEAMSSQGIYPPGLSVLESGFGLEKGMHSDVIDLHPPGTSHRDYVGRRHREQHSEGRRGQERYEKRNRDRDLERHRHIYGARDLERHDDKEVLIHGDRMINRHDDRDLERRNYAEVDKHGNRDKERHVDRNIARHVDNSMDKYGYQNMIRHNDIDIEQYEGRDKRHGDRDIERHGDREIERYNERNTEIDGDKLDRHSNTDIEIYGQGNLEIDGDRHRMRHSRQRERHLDQEFDRDIDSWDTDSRQLSVTDRQIYHDRKKGDDMDKDMSRTRGRDVDKGSEYYRKERHYHTRRFDKHIRDNVEDCDKRLVRGVSKSRVRDEFDVQDQEDHSSISRPHSRNSNHSPRENHHCQNENRSYRSRSRSHVSEVDRDSPHLKHRDRYNEERRHVNRKHKSQGSDSDDNIDYEDIERRMQMGYCFVEMVDKETALKVMHKLNGKIIPGTNPPKRFKLNMAAHGREHLLIPEYSLFVGELTEEVDDLALYNVFSSRFKSVHAAKVVLDPNGRSRGYGFVRFTDEGEQQKALVDMKGFTGVGGKALRVSNATKRMSNYNYNNYNQNQNQKRPVGNYSYPGYYQQYGWNYPNMQWDQSAYYGGFQHPMSSYYPTDDATKSKEPSENETNEEELEEPVLEVDVAQANREYMERSEELYTALEGSRWHPLDSYTSTISSKSN